MMDGSRYSEFTVLYGIRDSQHNYRQARVKYRSGITPKIDRSNLPTYVFYIRYSLIHNNNLWAVYNPGRNKFEPIRNGNMQGRGRAIKLTLGKSLGNILVPFVGGTMQATTVLERSTVFDARCQEKINK